MKLFNRKPKDKIKVATAFTLKSINKTSNSIRTKRVY